MLPVQNDLLIGTIRPLPAPLIFTLSVSIQQWGSFRGDATLLYISPGLGYTQVLLRWTVRAFYAYHQVNIRKQEVPISVFKKKF